MKKCFLIFFLFSLFAAIVSAHVKDDNLKWEIYHKKLEQCSNDFKTASDKCSDMWNKNCQPSLLEAHKKSHICTKNVGVNILTDFYKLKPDEAHQKIDNFYKFISEQYSLIFSNNRYCQNDKCGNISQLYTQNSISIDLFRYVELMIRSIESIS